MRTSQKTPGTITTIGIDLGKNTFHLVGLDKRGAIVLRRKVSRSQLEHRLANVPRCLIGMEACSGSHHIGRQLERSGPRRASDPGAVRQTIPQGHKNDYRDAEAIAEAVQRPTMSFVAIKTPEQMDLLALHRVRSRLVGQRTGVINQIRGFLIERGITVRQGVVPLRKALPDILSSNTDILSPRMVSLIADLACRTGAGWTSALRVSAEIEALAQQDDGCQRLMTVPGVGPIISSAMVAAIGNGAGFKQGRDFGAWLGLVPKQESTGDRTILGKISKRGNKYLRTLFVQAAHVVLVRRPSTAMRGLWPWIERGIEAAAPQHAGDRARQQARPHRLGGSRPRSRLSAQDRCQCRVTKARSGPPRGYPPPLSATVARPGRASDGGSEGMASRDPLTSNIRRGDLSIISINSFPPRSARWNEEMDERSARRNHETGCQDGPTRSFR